MRDKKFRKITEKNITSIYGKIIQIRNTGYRITKENCFPSGFSLASVNLDKEPFIPLGDILDIEVTLIKEFNMINISIRHKLLSLKTEFRKQFNLTVGTKIQLTGTSIKYKYKGKLFEISMVDYYSLSLIESSFGLPLSGNCDKINFDKMGFVYRGPNDIIDNRDKITIPVPTMIECSLLPPTKNVGITAKQFKEVSIGIGSKPDPLNLPDFPDFTEDDLPPLEDVMEGVSELEKEIGECSRKVEFKIPKKWKASDKLDKNSIYGQFGNNIND